nr:unnamed protein product [Digitaria exilis]
MDESLSEDLDDDDDAAVRNEDDFFLDVATCRSSSPPSAAADAAPPPRRCPTGRHSAVVPSGLPCSPAMDGEWGLPRRSLLHLQRHR